MRGEGEPSGTVNIVMAISSTTFAQFMGNNLRGIIIVWIFFFLRKGILYSKANLSLLPYLLEEAKEKARAVKFWLNEGLIN